ncbi:hypothetical protein [Stakelama saccharophila]|uniref:Heme exporter protein D n=1 Tax=Stakelama saccharophila TaxID=3075605 RepID=A0ABZ0B5F3_9SPHN|nr:hypothetical protein [Stakelama sp. W311]WNO52610.1 hypothetical protein RPR59_09010 [Stakelama sp. W311]
MNPWPFVLSAYGLTLIGTVSIALASWLSMHRAERAVEALRRQ